ncbi:hypothetical protein BU14_0082s0013 [Porphyra umbilicalis]|uniref:ATP adenylyltransferase C-terminal domain-containing protein n=1 Tax=Porphyra umbilicalis TaxID=2786 RepID=A0A1X6PEF6_PORUM|nr:hypothetical protein BU14_0082s0013 [Porphyra umbilicalis]|eukprot:OSX79248.1 hypothetical protein BU14_0082s0013 [Porphyra umbilicalis]
MAGAPAALLELARAASARALACGSLAPLATTTSVHPDRGIPFLLHTLSGPRKPTAVDPTVPPPPPPPAGAPNSTPSSPTTRPCLSPTPPPATSSSSTSSPSRRTTCSSSRPRTSGSRRCCPRPTLTPRGRCSPPSTASPFTMRGGWRARANTTSTSKSCRGRWRRAPRGGGGAHPRGSRPPRVGTAAGGGGGGGDLYACDAFPFAHAVCRVDDIPLGTGGGAPLMERYTRMLHAFLRDVPGLEAAAAGGGGGAADADGSADGGGGGAPPPVGANGHGNSHGNGAGNGGGGGDTANGGANGTPLAPGRPSPFPYNLLLTREHLWVVPRRAECAGGVSLNSLAYAGGLLVRDAEQASSVLRDGGVAALAHCAFPRT